MLRATGITKTFPGVRSLDRVDFAVEAGEIHALVGENGAGKSTLIKILSGAYVPDEGKLEFDGRVVAWTGPRKAQEAGIHVIYQELVLFPELSVAENIFIYDQPLTQLGFLDYPTMERRAEEARNFVAHGYPRNFVVQAVSSHPPLRERIARLQALLGPPPEAAASSEVTDDELRAKFAESVKFVRNLATTDPAVGAEIMQAALLALPAGRRLLEGKLGAQLERESTPRDPITEKLYESNLASTGDLRPNEVGDSSLLRTSAADPASSREFGLPDSAAKEALELEALAKNLGPVLASMQGKHTVTQRAAPDRPSGRRGTLLFWIVIAISAGAIVASLAIR